MSRANLKINLGEKQPAEVLDWKIILTRSLDADRTIASIEDVTVARTDATEETPALLVSGGDLPAPALADAGTAVIFWTAAGTPGARYKISFQLEGSDGDLILEVDCFLSVREV